MKLFKSKEEKAIQSFQKIIKESLGKPIRKLVFSITDMEKFMSKVKKNKEVKLMNFAAFVEKLEILLINNQFKPGYNITKGLSDLDKGKYPVYKKIAYIDNIAIINRFLNDDYKTYNFLFERVDLNKVLHNIQVAKDTHVVKMNYKATVDDALSGFNGIASTIIQMLVMVLMSQMILFPMLMQQIRDLGKVRTVNSLNALDQLGVTIFGGLGHYENMHYLMFWMGVAFFIIFCWFIFDFTSSLVKSYFLFNAKNNVRLIDKVANELGFCAILVKNIKLLEIGENTNKYQYVNFADFMLKNALEANNRGFTNDKFTHDFSYLFQFYYQFCSMPVGKELSLTEGFINLLEDILTSFKTSISGSGDFNLGNVYKKVNVYKENVAMKLFEKEFNTAKGEYAFAQLIAMALMIVANVLVSLLQGSGMNVLIHQIK